MTDHPSVAEFRRHFPGLGDTVHLASCSQGALSQELTGGLFEFQHTIREYGAPWDLWMTKVDEARSLFARFIGAHVDDVAVVSSASHGAFQVASTQTWSDRPRVVTTEMEFPSVAHVWLAQGVRGAEVEFVTDRDGVVDADDYADKIDETTGLVSVPLISYRNGLRLAVKEITAEAHTHGARVVVDAYQGTGVEPVNVQDLDCDYLISGALKYMLGISGIAFLYVRPGLRDDLDPSMTGWFGRRDPFEFDPRHLDYPAHARRFEAGTPSIPSAYGAVAGLTLLHGLDMGVVRAHICDLTRSLQDQLTANGEMLRSPKDDARRGPMVALYDEDPHGLDTFLKSRRIVGSARGEVVRLSLHFYNDESDVSAVVQSVADYRESH